MKDEIFRNKPEESVKAMRETTEKQKEDLYK